MNVKPTDTMLIPLTDANGNVLTDSGGQPLGTTLKRMGAIGVWSLRKLAEGHPYALRIDVDGTRTDVAFGDEGHSQIQTATDGFAKAAKVVDWYDQSGQGNHLAAGLANAPAYEPDSRSLLFNGHFLAASSLRDVPFDAAYALHIAFQQVGTASNETLCGTGQFQAGGVVMRTLGSGFDFAAYPDDFAVISTPDEPGERTLEKLAVNQQSPSDGLDFWQNGKKEISGFSYEYTALEKAFQNFKIGANGAGLNGANVRFFEALLFDRRLSDESIGFLQGV